MPRKYTKKSYKKRAPRRRKKYKSVVPRSGMLGKTHKQSFRYCTRINLDPAAGTSANYVFRANSLYDPDFTGTGHQPLGFDQLVGVYYNHYTVLASRIKVTFVSKSTNAESGPSIVSIEPNAGTTVSTSTEDIIEQGKATYKIMTNAYANQTCSLTRTCNMSKFLGQNVMDEDDNAGTVSSNPAEIVYWHVSAGGINGTVDAAYLQAIVQIDYLAVLHEPKNLVGS